MYTQSTVKNTTKSYKKIVLSEVFKVSTKGFHIGYGAYLVHTKVC